MPSQGGPFLTGIACILISGVRFAVAHNYRQDDINSNSDTLYLLYTYSHLSADSLEVLRTLHHIFLHPNVLLGHLIGDSLSQDSQFVGIGLELFMD